VRRVAFVLGVIVVVAALSYAGLIVLFETSGEVVAVRTVDADESPYESRLWVVDVDGRAYLRTGNAESRWLANMRSHPTVTITRGGVAKAYLATPVADVGVRDRVNAATAAKYGIAESFLRVAVLDAEHTIPVRLDPITE
jgi:hypothetical protein